MIDLVKGFMVSPGLKAQLLVPKPPGICKIILRLTPGNAREAKAAASIHDTREAVGVLNLGHLVTSTKLQRTPSQNAAFMRQIWARRGLLPDECGVPKKGS